jgi:predicted DNA-binding transcriptional regulator AlpA
MKRRKKRRNSPTEPTKQQIDSLQKRSTFLDVFRAKIGNISESCKAMGINRSTFYEWMDIDPNFRRGVEEIQEGLIDFSESKLMQAVDRGNITAIMFHLKTKGKTRGYIERTENAWVGNLRIEVLNKLGLLDATETTGPEGSPPQASRD